jgi:enamine deaminase RidA (YjgF/YER057c/UK114 family)
MSAIRIEERRSERRSFIESHLTALGAEGQPPLEAACEIFSYNDSAVTPIQERIFGPPEQRQEILDLRREALEVRGVEPTPCVYMSRKQGDQEAPLALQRWGIIPREGADLSVRTVEMPGCRGGRLLEAPELRLLWLAEITGTDGQGRLASGASEQAERMFLNAEAGLRLAGFHYREVVRTWISLRRLLDWYDELNRVRTAFHQSQGITGRPPGAPFPASTGIQGRCEDEECVMDLLAFQPRSEGMAEPLIRSSRQDQPFEYGSGFSRGMSLRLGEERTAMVSGTASIGPDGRTLHLGDRDAQALETLLSVAALLEPLGARLTDICSGTLFYKDTEALRAYERVTRLLELPELPLVPAMADICREDLLVEIEATALVPTPRRVD